MTIGLDSTIRLWSMSTFREFGKPIGSSGGAPVNAAAFSPTAS